MQFECPPVPRVEGDRGLVEGMLLPGSNDLAGNRLPEKSDRTDLPAGNSEPVRSVELHLTVAEAELIQLALAMALPKMHCYVRENGQTAFTRDVFFRVLRAVTASYERDQNWGGTINE
jgi:hypothetical protein